jgi:hypothetical protein
MFEAYCPDLRRRWRYVLTVLTVLAIELVIMRTCSLNIDLGESCVSSRDCNHGYWPAPRDHLRIKEKICTKSKWAIKMQVLS